MKKMKKVLDGGTSFAGCPVAEQERHSDRRMPSRLVP